MHAEKPRKERLHRGLAELARTVTIGRGGPVVVNSPANRPIQASPKHRRPHAHSRTTAPPIPTLRPEYISLGLANWTVGR